MAPVVDEGDGGEDGDDGDEDPGDDEAVRPQGLPGVQADVVAAPPTRTQIHTVSFIRDIFGLETVARKNYETSLDDLLELRDTSRLVKILWRL